jgi:hypothetical protein
MSEHHFSKGAADYASGALTLVRSRVAEHRRSTGAFPRQLILHVPTARRLFTEFAIEHGLEPPDPRFIRGGNDGAFEGVRFFICTCGNEWAEDQLVDQLGQVEPL